MPSPAHSALRKSTFGKACYVNVNRLPTDLSTESKSLRAQGISCARVALDVPLAKLFDYAVPAGLEVHAGDRVALPFGSRQRVGVVLEVAAHSDVPVSRMKTLSAVRDDAPRLPAEWLELMRFL